MSEGDVEFACPSPDALAAIRPGAPLTDALIAHLAECEACRRVVTASLAATLSSDAPGTSAEGVDAVPLVDPARYENVLSADGKPTVLGTGGYARVLLARDQVVGREVALKTLRSAQLVPSRRQVTERRLLQEARVIGQLEHPAIVPLHDLARTADGELFYAMRRIRGRTLAAAIEAAPSLEERLRLLPHVLAACHAVAYAHSRRDLKPQNVMVDRFGETVVIDWGLARARAEDDEGPAPAEGVVLVAGGETLSDGRGRLGTPAYMSPEQLTGVRALIDERSDVFGLGAVLFHVLTGRAPRAEGPLHEAPLKVLQVTPDVPVDLAALCDKALEPSRDARYQSAEELARDLDAWLHGQRVTAHAYRPLELVRRLVRQHRLTVAVALAGVLVLGLVSAVGALRVRDQRNQARSFALLLVGDVLDRLPVNADDPFRQELVARVADWLRASPETGDPTRAALSWAQLAYEYETAERFTEAQAAARECLAFATESTTDPLMQSAFLSCRRTAVLTDTSLRTSELVEQLLALWNQWPPTEGEPVELAHVHWLLASGIAAERLDLGQDSREWATRAVDIATRLTREQPGERWSWGALSFSHYFLMLDDLNATRGPDALTHADAALDASLRGHAVARSPRSLFLVADTLSGVRVVQRFFPHLVDPAVARATVEQTHRRFEALLELNGEDPVARRRYATFLLEEDQAERGWQLVAALTNRLGFDIERSSLYLALLSGEDRVVLASLAQMPEGKDTFDYHLLASLAHHQQGAWKAAAASARAAAKCTFSTSWPIVTMPAWASRQGGDGAPALQRLCSALTAAQVGNDSVRAAVALEDYAASLDAL